MLDSATALATQLSRVIAEQIAGMGVPIGHWLGLSGYRVVDLESEDFRLSLDGFRSLALDAQRLSGQPALGLLVGARLGMQAHGTLGYAAASSRSVREVLTLLQRYLGSRITLVGLGVEQGAAGVEVALEERVPLGAIRTLVLEGVLCSVKNVLQDVTIGACEVRRVHFPFPDPGYGAQAERLLRCPVHYNHDRAALILPNEVLDIPLRTSDPRAFRAAEALCRRELHALQERQSWEARVQRLLLETRVGFPSLEETASRLHITPRTLHRRLSAEDTSFRAILDEMRHRIAIDQLSNGASTVEEVAYILGYSDSSNFRRAFRRWTGRPPTSFRTPRREGPSPDNTTHRSGHRDPKRSR